MKQMSQMKEIIIATVAVATLMSCQSEKDKLYDEYYQLTNEYVAYIDTAEFESGVIDTVQIKMSMRLEDIERKLNINN